MTQETDFPRLANIPDAQYLSIITRIFYQISNKKMSRKEFREWAGENSIFDRETFDKLMTFLDIRYEDPVSYGDFGTQMLSSKNDEERQKLLFERLFSLNPLLMKYVLEALDTEHGGRLHSTNELFRILTSYVYPGKQPTLLSFQNWIRWLQASGYIKYIGVRWGLTEAGKGVLGRIRALDVDELLSEEEEAEETAEIPEQPRSIDQANEYGEKVSVAATGDEPAISGSPAVHHAPEEKPPEGLSQVKTAVEERARNVLPLPLFIPSPESDEFEIVEQRLISDETLFESAEKIRRWWRDFPYKKILSLSTIIPENFEKKSEQEEVLLIACASVLLAKGVVYHDVKRYLGFLAAQNFFSLAHKGKVDIAAMVKKFKSGGILRADEKLLESIAYFIHISQQISGFKFPKRDSHGRGFVTDLYDRFFAPFYPLAPFYMVKLLVTGEVVNAPSIESAASIPSYTLRENAFRSGFIDSVYAAGFNNLIDISERVTRFFGREENFDSPLASLHLGFGCSWRCCRVRICPIACREKFAF